MPSFGAWWPTPQHRSEPELKVHRSSHTIRKNKRRQQDQAAQRRPLGSSARKMLELALTATTLKSRALSPPKPQQSKDLWHLDPSCPGFHGNVLSEARAVDGRPTATLQGSKQLTRQAAVRLQWHEVLNQSQLRIFGGTCELAKAPLPEGDHHRGADGRLQPALLEL